MMFRSISNESVTLSGIPNSQSDGCVYCKARNDPGYYTHTKFNCPVLAGMDPCKICGKGGFDNHTERFAYTKFAHSDQSNFSHCPKKQRVRLPLRPGF